MPPKSAGKKNRGKDKEPENVIAVVDGAKVVAIIFGGGDMKVQFQANINCPTLIFLDHICRTALLKADEAVIATKNMEPSEEGVIPSIDESFLEKIDELKKTYSQPLNIRSKYDLIDENGASVNLNQVSVNISFFVGKGCT
jgi:hypothetical protein